MINNDDTNAFPYPLGHASAAEPSQSGGMTLRDYFAAKAMQSIINQGEVFVNADIGEVANWSYEYADAMLERRKS